VKNNLVGRRMSLYIRIDNPNVNSPVASTIAEGNPVEGPTKVCLVEAFASVVGSPNPDYAPDRKSVGKDLGCVVVSLAKQDPITLPFQANEFEEIVLDAERRHQIADFTQDHWSDRLNDLVAMRGPALV
jgi:hypothetical protein